MRRGRIPPQKQQEQQVEYSFKSFKSNYSQIQMLAKVINQHSKTIICEKIELICELAVWGDRNDTDVFDYFFEENIAQNLFGIMSRSEYKELTIEVIQFFAILLANLNDKSNVTYLLSHPVMTELIVYTYDFTDEEIVDYYISFLKSLSLRIDHSNLQLFFNQRQAYFPLVWQAMKFYNHKEIMVRTAVRTILLGIMRIPDQKLEIYFSKFPFVIFYLHFSCYLKNFWLEFNGEVTKGQADKETFNDLIDMLYFIQELYEFSKKEIFDNALLTYTIIPSIFGGILFQKKDTISITFSLYLLNSLITCKASSSLSRSLILLLYSPQMQTQLNQLLEQNVRQPRSFMYNWSFNNFWDQHLDIVKAQANLIFNVGINQYEESPECREELGIIHDVLGLKGAIGVTHCCQQILNNNGEQLVKNRIRECLFQYLQTSDDNFLYLILNLMKNILYTCDDEILRVCLFKEANTKEIIEERNKIFQHLLNIFLIDPSLRLCTLILSTQVIIYFLKIDKLILNEQSITQLYDVYYYTTYKLKNMMKSKQYNDILIQLYSLEYLKYNANLESFKLNLEYLAFNQIIDKYDSNIDLIYRMPVGLRETAVRDLAIFMMVDKVYNIIKGEDEEKAQFSSNSTNEWKVGKNYLPSDRQMLSCRICAKSFKDKLQSCKSGECFWIEDEENFIVVETQIVKENWAHVLYNAKIKDVEVMIDRAEPRILTVCMKLPQMNSIKEQYQDVQLYFDDYTYALQAKKFIDQMRREYSVKAQQKIHIKIDQAQKACELFKKK